MGLKPRTAASEALLCCFLNVPPGGGVRWTKEPRRPEAQRREEDLRKLKAET